MENNLENLNYRSKLLFGEPIKFNKIWIYPLTISEILEFSFNKYNKILSMISYTQNEIKEALGIFENLTLYDFIIANFVIDKNDDIKNAFLRFLELKTKEQVGFNSKGYFILGNQILDSENFNEFIQIIKDQNVLKDRKEKVVTKKEKDYKELVKKAREKHKSYLKSTGKLDDTDILDIISAISCKHPSLNILNIKNLTIYQLMDQLKRLNMIDEYHISIDSLLAGADRKQIDLIHWTKKYID